LATIKSLARYGADATEAMGMLKKLKLDKSKNVREAAAEAIAQIDADGPSKD